MSNNSKKTVADIIAIVNYAIGRMRRSWSISESELPDLRQDGYIAAIGADKSFDPLKGTWSTWVLKRVNGQLRTSLERMRNIGMTGIHARALQRIDLRGSVIDRDKDDEELDGSLDELLAAPESTDESADTESMITTLLSCVSSRSKQVLCLYYGLHDDSPSVSVSRLAERLGFSRKHAFSLLQKAQSEARACLGR